MAVFNWINYIDDLFVNTSTLVLAVPDSGYFLNFYDAVTGKYDYALEFENFMALSNAEVDPVNRYILFLILK